MVNIVEMVREESGGTLSKYAIPARSRWWAGPGGRPVCKMVASTLGPWLCLLGLASRTMLGLGIQSKVYRVSDAHLIIKVGIPAYTHTQTYTHTI